MKNRVIILSVTLVQLALLLCIWKYRLSDIPFTFCLVLLAGLIIIFPFFRPRSLPDAPERKKSPAGEGEPAAKQPDLSPGTPVAAVERDGVQPEAVETGRLAHKHIPTILVADDSEINRAILMEILGQFGLLTAEASDGQEAVDIVREWDISLVLMDLEMPVMDGKEATAQIRGMGKLPQDVPILAMTAHTDDSLRMDCLSLGMNGYLTKPVEVRELEAALRKWLPGGLPNAAGDGDSSLPAGSRAETTENDRNAPINMDAGLAATGGNKKLYYNLLGRFVERYGSGMDDLRELLGKASYTEAARLAHTIKGVAANLGMRRITELTKAIESCLPEITPGEALLAEFEEAMNEVVEYIGGLQGRQNVTLAMGDKALTDKAAETLRALLENLPYRVERDWGGIQSAFEKYIPDAEGTLVAGKFGALLGAIADFDIEGIERGAADLQMVLSDSR
ncbi:MAG: response regulator [Desulfovibrio sp.]|nr:response regulator [Desulfovibrio sp.]